MSVSDVLTIGVGLRGFVIGEEEGTCLVIKGPL